MKKGIFNKKIKKKGILGIIIVIFLVSIYTVYSYMNHTPLVDKPIEEITAEDLSITYHDNGQRIEIGDKYYPDVEPKTSFEELSQLLREFHFPRDYEEDVFDCSEMSACLEWWLEGHGYTTVIVSGEVTPSTNMAHMWLQVWTNKGWKHVEPTTIHFCPDSKENVYDIPTWRREIGSYEGIEELLEVSAVMELDWWNHI